MRFGRNFQTISCPAASHKLSDTPGRVLVCRAVRRFSLTDQRQSSGIDCLQGCVGIECHDVEGRKRGGWRQRGQSTDILHLGHGMFWV